jgi:hypothetical protein
MKVAVITVIVFAFVIVEYPQLVFGTIDKLDIKLRQFMAWLLK